MITFDDVTQNFQTLTGLTLSAAISSFDAMCEDPSNLESADDIVESEYFNAGFLYGQNYAYQLMAMRFINSLYCDNVIQDVDFIRISPDESNDRLDEKMALLSSSSDRLSCYKFKDAIQTALCHAECWAQELNEKEDLGQADKSEHAPQNDISDDEITLKNGVFAACIDLIDDVYKTKNHDDIHQYELISAFRVFHTLRQNQALTDDVSHESALGCALNGVEGSFRDNDFSRYAKIDELSHEGEDIRTSIAVACSQYNPPEKIHNITIVPSKSFVTPFKLN